MGLRINQNTEAFNSYRNLSINQNNQAKALEKLSSGFRINRAADDAAGLSISESLRQQIGGLKAGVRNAQDGISVAQTAEGALTEVHSMLQRMNELAVAYKSGTQGAESKAAITAEFEALKTEMTSIQTNTKFNGVQLFGSTSALTFQTGSSSTDTLSIGTDALSAFTSGACYSVINVENSDTLKAAIDEIGKQRGKLGAIQNQFEHRINNLNVAIENLSASESRIRDTDMASEVLNNTRSSILSQAAQGMLAQANQNPQGVLQLLR